MQNRKRKAPLPIIPNMEIMVMGLGEQMEDISECLSKVSQRKSPNKKKCTQKSRLPFKITKLKKNETHVINNLVLNLEPYDDYTEKNVFDLEPMKRLRETMQCKRKHPKITNSPYYLAHCYRCHAWV